MDFINQTKEDQKITSKVNSTQKLNYHLGPLLFSLLLDSSVDLFSKSCLPLLSYALLALFYMFSLLFMII